ncbi:MAG: hypothetical protein Q8Q47_11155 [Ignavibacteriaceae bacterium]|nr:hypothetical protein [Ignavibacteriaceae bacterium]
MKFGNSRTAIKNTGEDSEYAAFLISFYDNSILYRIILPSKYVLSR